MATDFFPGERYSTPAGVRSAFSEYFLLGSRGSVNGHFIGTILRSRARFHIEGMNRVRRAEGPLVFVSNHLSTLETGALPGLIVPMKPVTYIVLREGCARLAAGIFVIIFPQGTRTEVFDRSRFSSLGVKLATRAGVRLLPVAVKTDYWGSSGLLRGFGPVRRDRPIRIEFGESMPVAGRGKAGRFTLSVSQHR